MTIQEKPIYSISFSEYSTFQQCPHKWFLNYVLKIPSDVNEELVFGSALHNTIEALLTDRTLGRLSSDGTIIDAVFKDNLKKEISGITNLSVLKKLQEGWVAPTFVKQARNLILKLDLFNRFRGYEVADVEIRLDNLPIIEMEDFIIVYKGFIDLVLKNKKTGRYLIVDWKSSRKPWDIAKKEEDGNFYTQLKLYKHFYSLKKDIPLEMIDTAFYNLPRDTPDQQLQYDKEITQGELSSFMNDFGNNCADIIRFNHFKLPKARFTTKNNWCSRCHYNNLIMCNDLDEYQVVNVQDI